LKFRWDLNEKLSLFSIAYGVNMYPVDIWVDDETVKELGIVP
jgi:hypothetical protein